jgi:hypothetical protein
MTKRHNQLNNTIGQEALYRIGSKFGPENVSDTHTRRRGALVGAMALALTGTLAIGGNYAIKERRQEVAEQLTIPSTDQPHRVIVLEKGDTLFGISKKAYPKRDPREVMDLLIKQIPEEYQGIAQENEQFILPEDAQVGDLVQPEIEAQTQAEK